MVQIYSWLHSTFKELSNDTSHAQIRVKTKKYGSDKLDKVFYRTAKNYVETKFSAATEKLCHDIENYVVTWFSTAT